MNIIQGSAVRGRLGFAGRSASDNMQKGNIIRLYDSFLVVTTIGCSNGASETSTVLTQQQSPQGLETSQTLKSNVEDPHNNSLPSGPSASSDNIQDVPFNPSEFLADCSICGKSAHRFRPCMPSFYVRDRAARSLIGLVSEVSGSRWTVFVGLESAPQALHPQGLLTGSWGAVASVAAVRWGYPLPATQSQKHYASEFKIGGLLILKMGIKYGRCQKRRSGGV